jgi:protein-tyrosine phosphatase
VTDFLILTVCTGNICRSPLAEQLLRAGTIQWPGVSVASAGTGALVDHPMTDEAQALAREFGATDSHSHVARALTVEQLRDADLVIALSREHRRSVVELLPRGARHTFTLRELARLLEGISDDDLVDVASLDPSDTAGRLAGLVEVAASRRGLVEPPDSPDDDDVIDPYRQSDDIYRRSADQLVPAVNLVLAQFARALAAGRP